MFVAITGKHFISTSRGGKDIWVGASKETSQPAEHWNERGSCGWLLSLVNEKAAVFSSSFPSLLQVFSFFTILVVVVVLYSKVVVYRVE